MARAAAEFQQKMKELQTASAKFSVAERACQEGDILLASRIYVHYASGRDDAVGVEAKRRLSELAEEARKKLGDLDAKLAREEASYSPGELLGRDGLPPPWEEAVARAFVDYNKLADDYSSVPAVKSELKKHLAAQRLRPHVAAVLNEPKAATLWQMGQRHEHDSQSCCAYWVYKQAADLLPAPSAVRASHRFAEMDEDPQLVASAKACRELRECHDLYNLAEKIVPHRPARAKELFAQIVQRTPRESEIHGAARKRVEEMSR
jgi:hypothetical protein